MASTVLQLVELSPKLLEKQPNLVQHLRLVPNLLAGQQAVVKAALYEANKAGAVELLGVRCHVNADLAKDLLCYQVFLHNAQVLVARQYPGKVVQRADLVFNGARLPPEAVAAIAEGEWGWRGGVAGCVCGCLVG